MPSTSDDRIALIKSNYQDALDNEPHDLAAALTAADVTGVQANLATARNAFYTAAAADLSNSGDAIEDAYKVAQSAQQLVKQARAASEKIATLLGKLQTATEKATSTFFICLTRR